MGKKKKEESGGGGGAPLWMVTFGDMMSLLLTFFILILSFSSIQEAGFKKAIGSLQGSLGILGDYEYMIELGKIMVPDERFSFISQRTKQTTGEISKRLNFISEYENVQLVHDDRGLNIILPAEVAFDSGDDRLKEEASPLLKKIGAFLFELKKKQIIVEGHTDNRPSNSLRFPSNWHLSSARAISIINFLNKVCAIDNNRMQAVGRGEYDPVVPNNSAGNREKNRRVVILIAGNY